MNVEQEFVEDGLFDCYRLLSLGLRGLSVDGNGILLFLSKDHDVHVERRSEYIYSSLSSAFVQCLTW